MICKAGHGKGFFVAGQLENSTVRSIPNCLGHISEVHPACVKIIVSEKTDCGVKNDKCNREETKNNQMDIFTKKIRPITWKFERQT